MSEISQWMKKIEELKKGEADLSRDEDLSIGIMNLISLEEHLFFTAMKTNDAKYLELLNQIRSIRKQMLAKIVTNPQGEEWCISKHLLAASMRLMEVGTKELSTKNAKEAMPYFQHSFDLYSLFFGINLKLLDTQKLKTDAGVKVGMMKRISGIVKEVIDCCKEV